MKYGDLVFIVTRPSFISNVFALCGKEQFEIKNIVIVGASRIGIKTASLLEKNYHVKIIEKDREKCIQLADKLKSTLVINGDGRDLTLLREEGIKNVDAFISLTGSAVINAWIVRKKLTVREKSSQGSRDKKMIVNVYKNGSDGKSSNVWKKLSYKKSERIGESVKFEKNLNDGKKLSNRKDERSRENVKTEKNYPVMDAVDESIADSCETILKIGGYIILFSIITSIIEYIIPEKYDVAGCIAAGITEVSTGAMQLAVNEWLSGIRVIMTDAKTIVTVWLCAFGGISSVAQTYSVLSGTDLSIKKYVIAKIRQGFIAVILALLVFRI